MNSVAIGKTTTAVKVSVLFAVNISINPIVDFGHKKSVKRNINAPNKKHKKTLKNRSSYSCHILVHVNMIFNIDVEIAKA